MMLISLIDLAHEELKDSLSNNSLAREILHLYVVGDDSWKCAKKKTQLRLLEEDDPVPTGFNFIDCVH